jgi:2-oxoglutarate dehydrogenase E1 component
MALPLSAAESKGGVQAPYDAMTRRAENEAFQLSSFLYGGNAAYLEDLYARYQERPDSVDEKWRSFFSAL